MRFSHSTLSQIATAILTLTSVSVYAETKAPTIGEAGKPDPIAKIPEEGLIPSSLVLLGKGQYFSEHALVMDKANRTLTIWKQKDSGLELVMAVPADFGRNGGDKVSEGDYKTPEGIYFFQQMKEGAGLLFEEYGVRAFTLDYPNFFDQIDKKSGSGIWLHAIPDKKSLLRGSRGCVVVRNEVIKSISPYISLKRTPILIEDSIKYVSTTDSTPQRKQWQDWLEKWRLSWQEKNLDTYIGMYGSGFKSMGMNRDKWREYKKGLNEKYGYIKVGMTEPIVIVHRNELIVRFLQEYESDKKTDFGEKTLYLRREGEDYKIVGEEWQPARRDAVVATMPTSSTEKHD